MICSAGIELIKECEGLRLKAYPDTGGVWTIGYGHTHEVLPGDEITIEAAHDFLLEDIGIAERAVGRLVVVPLNENQRAALVCLVFNIGGGRLMSSTLLHLLNGGDTALASEQFLRWVKDNGVPLPSLITRRKKEQALFNTPTF